MQCVSGYSYMPELKTAITTSDNLIASEVCLHAMDERWLTDTLAKEIDHFEYV